MLLYGIAALLFVATGSAIFVWMRRGALEEEPPQSPSPKLDNTHKRVGGGDSAPFQTEATAEAQTALYRLAFGVKRIDYQILGDHQQVLRATEGSIGSIVNEPRYFPRKPSLLPKLLRAINALDSGRKEIVRLILQDAVLAGNVLKRANSAFYRQGQEVVESVDRAVTILGNEGLRAPVATAVMQPVFQLPVGFFEQFAPVTWEQARRSAVAAEEFARIQNSSDALVAHLAGMLGGLAHIVLFRLVNDKYRQKGNIMPRAEVFIRVMIDHGPAVARDIAVAWEMTPAFVDALAAQISGVSPEQMAPLARAVYYGNLVGSLATLHCRGEYTADAAHKLLESQGLNNESAARLWSAAIQTDVG